MQNSKLLSLFISLQIDCFHSQLTVNICIAGLNRRAGYATACTLTVFLSFLCVGMTAALPVSSTSYMVGDNFTVNINYIIYYING